MTPISHILHDLPDDGVDTDLDAELRALLVRCFPKDEACFSKHRHYRQPPRHRWIVRDAQGKLIAHACIHDKMIGSPEGELHIGGVAEVCVAPDGRGQGLVKLLMTHIQRWLMENQFEFSLLFGKVGVYSSSGYRSVDNSFRHLDPKTNQWVIGPIDNAMVLSLGRRSWPVGEIDLGGPKF